MILAPIPTQCMMVSTHEPCAHTSSVLVFKRLKEINNLAYFDNNPVRILATSVLIQTEATVCKCFWPEAANRDTKHDGAERIADFTAVVKVTY